MTKNFNAALKQDQWEAIQDGCGYFERVPIRPAPVGMDLSAYAPVPPIVLSQRRGLYLLELKEDE